MSNIVAQASEILKEAANGDFSFDSAFDKIEKLDLTKFKKTDESLTVDISFMLFAGMDSKHLGISSIGGTEVLISKRALDEFTKSCLLKKLKLNEIEKKQMESVIAAYEGALERYGHFKDDNNKKEHENN